MELPSGIEWEIPKKKKKKKKKKKPRIYSDSLFSQGVFLALLWLLSLVLRGMNS